MVKKIQKNNHCPTKLLWEEEYPMNYLFTSSTDNDFDKMKLFPNEEEIEKPAIPEKPEEK